MNTCLDKTINIHSFVFCWLHITLHVDLETIFGYLRKLRRSSVLLGTVPSVPSGGYAPGASGLLLTFALLGGVWTPPLRFFLRIARKRRRAAPPCFHLPYPPSFWQLLRKFRSWVMQGQVTRSGQVTIPYKNFTVAPQLQCLRESYETFGIW